MNKLILISFLLFNPAALAVPIEMLLQIDGHSGNQSLTRLQLSPQQITLNGIALSSHILPAVSGPLSVLLHPKNDTAGGCGAGTYVHQVTYKSKRQVAKGCLNSKTAQTLVDSVRKIERLSYLRRLPSAQ